jgi:hypothetical protein
MIKKFVEMYQPLNEAKMPSVSKELMKATEKMHAEQLKQQELQKKFVTETDPKKKEKMKADLIAQHKAVKKVEAAFQEALGREHVDYDDELLESDSQLNEGVILKAITPRLEGEVKTAVEALENELQSIGVSLDNKQADRLADCVIDIIDAAKQEAADEYND